MVDALTRASVEGERKESRPAETAKARAAGSAYIPTLDGWRAIAVALVVVCHTVGPETPWRDAAGGLGVSIFFGISGYLICTRLLEEERRAGAISLSKFYVRRAFRILPPAFAYLAVIVVLGLCGVFRVTILEILAAAFFFRNYAPGHWYSGHFWSLAVEEHFYLFFPALLVALGRRRTRWAAIAISLATAVWRVVDTRYGILTSHLPEGVYAAARTDFRLDGLMLGCLAALVFFERPPTRGHRLFAFLPWITGALLIANMAHLCPLPELFKAVAIVVMLVSAVWTPGTPLSKALELAPVRWVGRLSYSLYLWQQLFFVKYPGTEAPSLAWLQRFPLNLVLLLAAATASYYLLERPMVKVGHRLGKSPVPARH
ncbi:MAG TPA: acyltransferase [Polyangiaceae bacterium]|jgi:peptidoglycan/LPS O-acetylase OafA/YrhL